MNLPRLLSLGLGLVVGTLLSHSARADWTGGAGAVSGVNSFIVSDTNNWAGDDLNWRFINPAPDVTADLDFRFAASGSWSGTINGDFVFTNTGAYNVTFGVNGSTNHRLTFNGPGNSANFIVDIGLNTVASTNKQVNFGRNDRVMVLDFQGKEAVFQISPSIKTPIYQGSNNYIDTTYMYATGTNLSALTKTGGGALYLTGGTAQVFTVSGPVTVSGGMLELQQTTGGQAMLTPRIIGATKYDVIGVGSSLVLNTRNATAGSAGSLIEASSTVSLYSGVLGALTDNANGTAQNIAKVVLGSGRNGLGTGLNSNRAAGDPFTITIGELVRENYATLNFLSNNLGVSGATAAASIKVTNYQPIVDALVGGGGAAGTTTVSILPWATGQSTGINSMWGNWRYDSSDPYAGTDFVTYDPALGFRTLTASEYFTTGTAAAGGNTINDVNASGKDNVYVTTENQTLSANRTVNALKADRQIKFNGKTLTITSGALYAGGASFGENRSDTGFINSGVNPLIINGYNNVNFFIPITNSVADGPGVIIAQTRYYNGWNPVYFNVANDYQGSTLVQGHLQLRHADAIPYTSDLRIDLGGSVTLSTSEANGANGIAIRTPSLSGNGTVNFTGSPSNAANAPAQLNILDPNLTGSELAAALDAVKAKGTRSINIATGGVIAPGDATGQLQTGTLLIGDQVAAVNFLASSTLQFDLASAALSDRLEFLSPATTLSFESGASISLNFLNGYTPADGDTWQLTSGVTSVSGWSDVLLKKGNVALPTDEWSLDFSGGNLVLQYTAQIPEPGTLALLLSGTALLLTLRRRR